MSRKKLIFTIIAFILIFNITAMAQTTDPFDYARTLYEHIEKNYAGEIDEQILTDNLIKGITNSLDEYSFAYNNEETQMYLSGLTGKYEGIGISFSIVENLPKVMTVFSDTPAYKAGIVANDVIISVDKKSTKGLTTQAIKSMITGEKGTAVELTIQRPGIEENIDFVIKRDEILIKSVYYEIIEDDIGYLEIRQFVEGTYSEVKEAIEYFQENRIKKVVLDLRDNPGGIVSQAVMVAAEFVPSGTVTKLDFANPDAIDYRYTSSLVNKKFQLRVLINENSASASEILAAAIKERNAGTIVGENSYGKGVFQNGYSIVDYEKYINNFDESNTKLVLEGDYLRKGLGVSENELGGYIQFTTGNYLTPNGNNLQGIGIEPDVVVSYEETDNEVKYISRLNDGYNYDAGSNELIVVNAKKILKLLNYYDKEIDTEKTEEFKEALKKFQKSEGIIETGELNYITKLGLDYHLKDLKIEKDPQLKTACELLE